MSSYSSLILVLFLLLAGQCWCGFRGDSFYDNSVVLSHDVYELYWKVLYDEIYIAMSVATPGWVAFGIAEQTSGSMPGSDIVSGKIAILHQNLIMLHRLCH